VAKDGASFFYRWPGGESPADVYCRMSQLKESLHREWHLPARAENYVLVTHNAVILLFLMCWFQWDINTWEHLHKLKTGKVGRARRW
jgi:broad specificity phosphatase PhoE